MNEPKFGGKEGGKEAGAKVIKNFIESRKPNLGVMNALGEIFTKLAKNGGAIPELNELVQRVRDAMILKNPASKDEALRSLATLEERLIGAGITPEDVNNVANIRATLAQI